jgi:hypothetical protein
MTIYKPPKTFKHNVAISNDSIFLKGPKPWQDSVIDMIKDYNDINILCSDKDFTEGWELESIDKSEAAIFYFNNSIEVFNIVTVLVGKMTQFPAETYLYIEEDYEYKELLERICEMCKIKILKTKKEIKPLILNLMSYLMEPVHAVL